MYGLLVYHFVLYIVFEILLWFVQTGNWKEAFERVIPLRKIDKNESTGVSEEVSDLQTSKQETDEQETIKQEASKCDQACTSSS